MGGHQGKIPNIDIKITSWATTKKDSESLFDYACDNYTTFNSHINEDTFIYRNNNNISLYTKSEKHKKHYEEIFIMKIFQSKKNYRIFLPNSNNNMIRHYVWLTLKYAHPIHFKDRDDILCNSSILCINDIIKIGKLIFKINNIVVNRKKEDLNGKIMDVISDCDREIVTVKENVKDKGENLELKMKGNQELNSSDKSKDESNIIKKVEQITPNNAKGEDTKQEISCRLCYESESTMENPLVAPCRCKGSMKYIHLLCLRKWSGKNFIITKFEKGISYYCKELCELCKISFHELFEANDQRAAYFGISRPNCPFIEFEQIKDEALIDQRYEGAMIMHITMDNVSTITIGRGHETQFRLNDISVSRNHAKIHLISNQFYLEDTNSKFGTLIKIDNKIVIRKATDLIIQTGKSLIEFKYQKSIFSCLNHLSDDESDSEEESPISEKEFDGKIKSEKENGDIHTVRPIVTQNDEENI